MDAENRSAQQNNFDHWLDLALQARVNAEPRVGIEERVLVRLASEPERKVWRPVVAVAGAAVVVIALAIAVVSPSPDAPTTLRGATQPAIVSGLTRATQTGQMPRAAVTAKARRGGRVASRKPLSRSPIEQQLPKLAAFPTPRPETLQERLLYRLAAQPDAVQRASLNLDSPIRELSIPELKIEPMEGTPPDNSRQ